MNLEQSDFYKEKLESNTKKRRGVMLSIILCAILVTLLFALIMVLKYQDSITEKMFLNDTQVAIPQNFYKVKEDGTVYLNVRVVGEMLGYKYTKGEYKKFNEDEQSCYLKNNFEVVSMSASSDKFQKYIEVAEKSLLGEIEVSMKNEKGYKETFKLANPLENTENGIYASVADISEMLNVNIDWQEYRFKFYSLDYMVNYAKTVLGKLGITEMSGYYENLKTALYGYIVVGSGGAQTTNTKSESLYGVISLTDGKEIISIQYDDIKFVQNVKEFYVTASNGTMGIMGADGSTIIEPSEYEEISLLDDVNQLYLVRKEEEYGVVNRKGKIIVHAENDEVGLDVEEFELEEIENPALLFGKCIPVKKGEKFGMYNIEGDLVLGLVYDSLGYITEAEATTSGSEESVLIIPGSIGINGIVINLNGLYGIFDVNTQEIVLPTVYNKIYGITKFGETTYYMEIDGETKVLREVLEERGLINIDENGNYVEKNEEPVEESEEQTKEPSGKTPVRKEEVPTETGLTEENSSEGTSVVLDEEETAETSETQEGNSEEVPE